MSNVYQVSPAAYIGHEWVESYHCSGSWEVASADLPGLPVPDGRAFENLYIWLELSMTDRKPMFEAAIEISFRGGDFDIITPHTAFRAKRSEMMHGHLWTRRQIEEGVTVRVPIVHTKEEFEQALLNELFQSLLESSRPVIRWDEEGLVVSVNIGRTFISTREHAVEEEGEDQK